MIPIPVMDYGSTVTEELLRGQSAQQRQARCGGFVAASVLLAWVMGLAAFELVLQAQAPQACERAAHTLRYPLADAAGQLCWGCNGRIIFDICFNRDSDG